MFSEIIPLSVVLKNGLQIYQFELSNWGNIGATADPNSVVSPRFQFPISGLAIDPESTAAYAIVRPSTNNSISPAQAVQPYDFIITKDRPFIGRLSFPRISNLDGGWGIVAPNSERFSNVFVGLTGQQSNNFGATVVAPTVFEAPSLKLIAYVDAGPPYPNSPARVPYRTNKTYAAPDLNMRSLGFFPVSGRKSVKINARGITGAGNWTIRTLGLTATQSGSNLVDGRLAADVVTGAPFSENAYIQVDNLDGCVQYLHLLGQAPVGGDLLNYSIVASD